MTRQIFPAVHFTYTPQSVKDGNLYVGSTSDLRGRLEQYYSGKVQSTRSRRPLKLIYFEGFVSTEDSRIRERYLKTGWGRRYVKKFFEILCQAPPEGGES